MPWETLHLPLVPKEITDIATGKGDVQLSQFWNFKNLLTLRIKTKSHLVKGTLNIVKSWEGAHNLGQLRQNKKFHYTEIRKGIKFQHPGPVKQPNKTSQETPCYILS